MKAQLKHGLVLLCMAVLAGGFLLWILGTAMIAAFLYICGAALLWFIFYVLPRVSERFRNYLRWMRIA